MAKAARKHKTPYARSTEQQADDRMSVHDAGTMLLKHYGKVHEARESLGSGIRRGVPQIAGSPFVFTTNGAAPSSGYSKNKRRLDALLQADMPPWRLHDLRRTVASGMARLNINLPVIEKVLNHSSGSFAGIVGVYQRHSFADEKRAALEAWGNFVAALVGSEPVSKSSVCASSRE